jgi:hypothetical protein
MPGESIVKTVEQFSDWFFANNHPLKPPFTDPMYHTDISMSFVWYRAAPWQVELYMVRPNTVAPNHNHPDIDSLDVYLSGTFTMIGLDSSLDLSSLSQHMDTPRFDGMHRLYGHTIKIPPGQNYGGVFGDKGGVFWSIQKWVNGVTPSSVTKNWHGDTIGEHHKKIIIPPVQDSTV